MYEAAKANISGSERKTAVCYYGKKLSFDRVFYLVDALAENLSARYGVGEGDAVTLCMPNSPSALLCFYAANKLGAAVNLAHPYLPPEKLAESAERTKSKLIVVYDSYPAFASRVPVLESDNGFFMGLAAKLYYRCTAKKSGRKEKLEGLLKRANKGAFPPPVRFAEGAAAVYLASGGTTGEPKIIMHGNHAFNLLCAKAPEFLRYDVEEYGALYNVLPIFHGFGLCINMHMCMMMRKTNIMCAKFDAKRSAKEIVRRKANILTGVPTMYLKLLARKEFTNADLSHIKDVFVGGDSAGEELISRFNAVLEKGGSPARMYEGYGLTETVTVCVVNTARHNKAGSIGYPLSDTEIAVAKDGKFLPAGEVGEICLSTPQFMLGYLDDDGYPFVEIDGRKWLKTGDCGYLDGEGFLYFKQRIKNMIKVSGVPVYPSEIERVAAGVKGVLKACAVGVPDGVKGQKVKLYVQAEEGGDALKENILAACREKLIAYAVPKEIVVRDKLPVSLIGKIDRKALEKENET